MNIVSPSFFQDLKALRYVSFKHGVFITTEPLNVDAALFDSRLHHDALYLWIGSLHIVFDLSATAQQTA